VPRLNPRSNLTQGLNPYGSSTQSVRKLLLFVQFRRSLRRPHPVIVEHSVKSFARDAQQLRGFALVAVSHLQRPDQRFAFDCIQTENSAAFRGMGLWPMSIRFNLIRNRNVWSAVFISLDRTHGRDAHATT